MSGPEPSGSHAATYVYGVTRADAAPPDVPGVGAGTGAGAGDPGEAVVRIVPWDELGALVSDVDPAQVGSARALRAHARVLDEAIKAGPVVPLRFGTMVDDDSAVVSTVLQRNRDEFHDLLERFAQHVELAVRMSYDDDAVLRQVIATDPAIAARHDRLAGVDPEAAYYERIALGEQVAAALEQRRDRDAEEIYDALCAVADDVCVAEPASPQVLVNGSFLLRRTALDAFNEAIGSSADARPELRVHVIGPLPPYSFSDIELVG